MQRQHFDTRILRKPPQVLEIEHYKVRLGGPNPLLANYILGQLLC